MRPVLQPYIFTLKWGSQRDSEYDCRTTTNPPDTKLCSGMENEVEGALSTAVVFMLTLWSWRNKRNCCYTVSKPIVHWGCGGQWRSLGVLIKTYSNSTSWLWDSHCLVSGHPSQDLSRLRKIEHASGSVLGSSLKTISSGLFWNAMFALMPHVL